MANFRFLWLSPLFLAPLGSGQNLNDGGTEKNFRRQKNLTPLSQGKKSLTPPKVGVKKFDPPPFQKS